jgi:XapX domain-containing protein
LRPYLAALAAGALVGIIYGLMNVRSPAPPVIGLVGLLGILLGEQAVPLAKRLLASEPITASWLLETCHPHVLGKLPGGPGPTMRRESCGLEPAEKEFEHDD